MSMQPFSLSEHAVQLRRELVAEFCFQLRQSPERAAVIIGYSVEVVIADIEFINENRESFSCGELEESQDESLRV